MRKAVEIIKLILTGTYATIKSNSFRQGYFPLYLSYGFFFKTTTVVCEGNLTYKNPNDYKTYATSIQGT